MGIPEQMIAKDTKFDDWCYCMTSFKHSVFLLVQYDYQFIKKICINALELQITADEQVLICFWDVHETVFVQRLFSPKDTPALILFFSFLQGNYKRVPISAAQPSHFPVKSKAIKPNDPKFVVWYAN